MKSPIAFRTISEVAADLNVPQHVLRFWETRFTQIKPLKRQGGRRYYRPEDVRLLRGIRTLLYGEGYRIDGVQKLLKERGAAFVSAAGEGGAVAAEAPHPFDDGDDPLLSGPHDDDAGSSNGEDFDPAIVAEAAPAAPALSDENRRRLEAALAALERVRMLLDREAGSRSRGR